MRGYDLLMAKRLKPAKSLLGGYDSENRKPLGHFKRERDVHGSSPGSAPRLGGSQGLQLPGPEHTGVMLLAAGRVRASGYARGPLNQLAN
ncbi:unnamed protein product [Clonostachys solani]|uniref:Uncharacterized protein n=1 Tax=Clonostachys solani TaxID=160281 RepID=A0A9N9ZLB3_9HYPO|nr:unnamed protein product [Clonostachys solani]